MGDLWTTVATPPGKLFYFSQKIACLCADRLMDRTRRRRGGGTMGTSAISAAGAALFQDAYAMHGRGTLINEVAVRKTGPIYGGPPMGNAWRGMSDRSRYALPASLNSNICSVGNSVQSPTKPVPPVPVEPMCQDAAFMRAHSPFRARHGEMREQMSHGELERGFERGLEQRLRASGTSIALLGSGPGSSRTSF